jgi:hypothetical protein
MFTFSSSVSLLMRAFILAVVSNAVCAEAVMQADNESIDSHIFTRGLLVISVACFF